MLSLHTILRDRYRIEDHLGRGGMGTVYIATDRNLDRAVAIKCFTLSDPELQKAFENEAKLLSRLRHPSLPVVVDYFPVEHSYCIVMDFVKGDNLGVVMRKNKKPLAVAEALRISNQLLLALEFLHESDPPIIHRDIKPENVKVEPGGRVMLLDFGLAKGTVEEMTRSARSSVFGYTLEYAPLEQIQGAGTDGRSDLYSLAAMLYHLLTGSLPANSLERAAALVSRHPDPLILANRINPAVPSGMSSIIQGALAMDPNRRPQKAKDLRASLQEAAKDSAMIVEGTAGTVHSPTIPARGSTQLSSTYAVPGGTVLSPTRPAPPPLPRRAGSPVKSPAWQKPNLKSGTAAKLKARKFLVISGTIALSLVSLFLGFLNLRTALDSLKSIRADQIPEVEDPESQQSEATPGKVTKKEEFVPDNFLAPVKELQVDGAVVKMIPSFDRKLVYALDTTQSRVLVIDVTERSVAKTIELHSETHNLSLSPSDGMLYISAVPHGSRTNTKEGIIHVVDANELAEIQSFGIAFGPEEIISDDGGILYVNGYGDSGSLAVIDVLSNSIREEIEGMFLFSSLRKSPMGSRLYWVNSDGFFAAPLVDLSKESTYMFEEDDKHPSGWPFEISPDGRLLVCSTGTVLSLSPLRDEDLAPIGNIDQHLGCAFAPELGLFFISTRKKTLQIYSYPDLTLKKTLISSNLLTHLMFDEGTQTLFAASTNEIVGFDYAIGYRKTKHNIRIYDLRTLLSQPPFQK